MADAKRKDSASISGTSDDGLGNHVGIYERPTGIRGIYSHPITQVSLLGFVCFMGPGSVLSIIIFNYFLSVVLGLFNALNGLGAGGQVDSTTSANANSALYATFAAGAFFSGYVIVTLHMYPPSIQPIYTRSINNKLGSRLTLLLGITGYSLYIGAFLCVNT